MKQDDERQLFLNPMYPVEVALKELTFADKNSEAKDIVNEAIEVLIVNNGSLRVAHEKTHMVLNAGDGLIINYRVRHRMYPVGAEKCGYYSVLFDPRFIFTEELYKKYGGPYVENSNMTLMKLNDEVLCDDAILDSFNKIIASNMIKKPGYELQTEGLLCYAWLAFLEFLNEGARSFSGRNIPSQDERRISMATEYICEHFSEMLTLHDIAEQIHVSDSECCRCFSRIIGMPPMEYLMRYRIYEAVKILYKNPASVSSIQNLSYTVGFNSPSYFNRVFKRCMDCTPSEYKKLLKQDLDRAERMFSIIQEGVMLL